MAQCCHSIGVRFILAAVIIFIVYVQFISGKPAYVGRDGGRSRNAIADHGHKHLTVLKAPDPQVVETVKKRIKHRNLGRKVDQSNERNLWRSHPKKEDYVGPDTDEVFGVIPSLGI